MKITNEAAAAAGFILPTPIAPREAAMLLMEGQHVVVIASSEIPEHLEFTIALARALPGRLSLLWFVPGRVPGTSSTLNYAPEDNAPGLDVVFFQDGEDARTAIDLAVLRSGCALTELFRERELAGTGPAPILLLDAPADCAVLTAPDLDRDYRLTVAFLLALHAGKVKDLTAS